MIDIERIKREIDISSLIARHFTITGSGSTLGTEEHDSLKIFTETNSYCWYSKGADNAGSVIDWMVNEEGMSKAGAIRSLSAMLDGESMPVSAIVQSERKPKMQGLEWARNANRKLSAAQSLLYESAGADARDYLEARGLKPETWRAFGLGYADKHPSGAFDYESKTEFYPKQPAIVMPWFSGENQKLIGIRYRFLQKHTFTDKSGAEQKDVKLTSLHDSNFKERLFGGHCLKSYDGGHILLICEGEINAMSIWQECPNVDVLSMGSQSQNFSPRFNEFVSRWNHVITWLDEPKLAKSAAIRLTGAHAISSFNGEDANDLLRLGILGNYLNAVFERLDIVDPLNIDLFVDPDYPAAAERPCLPVELWNDFATYAEAWAAGRHLLTDYQIATWLDRDTGRYRVTAPGASARVRT